MSSTRSSKQSSTGDLKIKTKETESFDDGSQQHSDEEKQEDDEERQLIAGLLFQHAYHLPGNNMTQDLWQYLTNNHPIVGICLHHKYHPLSWKLRMLTLFGSVLFGLALTNIVYLAFVFAAQDDAFDKRYYEFQTNLTVTGLNEDFDENVSKLSVTNGNIVLWTVGAFIHGIYDNTIWSLATFQCCARKDGKDTSKSSVTGAFLVMLSTVLVTAVATFAVMLRAALAADSTDTTTTIVVNPSISDSHNQVYSQFQVVHQQEFQDYEFIVSYFVELVLSYIVYYPIAAIILFSGIASCGRSPVTGGRPYELRREREAKKSQAAGQLVQEQGVEVEWMDSSARGDSSAGSKNTKTGGADSNTCSEDKGCTL